MANKPAHTTNKEFIKQISVMGKNHLADEFLALAHNIEQALLKSGAVPGVDYTRLDLFQLAQPFALEKFQCSPDMTYDYPSEHVIS